ncbi:IclR family transcriptional regulator [Nocardioides sp.]|uniref:IclR family transcriptional regulator n=1 Tax=Nocardioides sp. TaxID=35761 RepID=UPI00273489EF|nr:IclR family transcriptional regulator [Nocardioides sp.]MDP3893360.1 IclR family transcriptional regulator [Nocardioides sp.]
MSNSEQGKATTKRASSEPSGGVQSVDRAITVLEILAREGSAGVSEVASEVGVHKSTAFRLLAALEDRDLVEQNHERGKYQLGFGVLRLAGAIPTRLDVVRQAQSVVDDLAARLDETINVAVVRKHYAVHVQQALGSAAVASQNWVGQLTPLHATSSGKVLLAFMSDEQCNAILDEAGLQEFTEHTITSRKALLEQLRQVRVDGFATAIEEYETGLNAAAVPVRDHTGAVVAALSAAGPAYRMDEANIKAQLTDLEAAGAQISRRMGYLDRVPAQH